MKKQDTLQSVSRLSSITLVLANLIPIIGVLFFDWDLFQIFFIYWIEGAVIGFYTIIKFIVVDKIFSLLSVPLFLIHYGVFMLLHFFMIVAFFGTESIETWPSLPKTTLILLLNTSIIPGIALLISHGISFVRNFISNGEYKKISARKSIHDNTYRRVVFMHIALLFGGYLAWLFGAPTPALLILIILKTTIDLGSHIRAHLLIQKKTDSKITKFGKNLMQDIIDEISW